MNYGRRHAVDDMLAAQAPSIPKPGIEGVERAYYNPTPQGGTPRGRLLAQALELTEGNRNAAYGDPVVNLGLQGRLMDVFFEEFDKNVSLGYLDSTGVAALRGAVSQIIGKLARVGAGDVTRLDNYIDGAAYFGIAGEAVERCAAPVSGAASAR